MLPIIWYLLIMFSQQGYDNCSMAYREALFAGEKTSRNGERVSAIERRSLSRIESYSLGFLILTFVVTFLIIRILGP